MPRALARGILYSDFARQANLRLMWDMVPLRQIVASLATLQAVEAAVVHQPNIVLSLANVAKLIALALLFHFVANDAPKSLGHGRTLARICSSCNCLFVASERALLVVLAAC
jgi:hypothetical protein